MWRSRFPSNDAGVHAKAVGPSSEEESSEGCREVSEADTLLLHAAKRQ